MNEVLVSIIVPVYNVDAYLERCVESLINQTYRNIEIILIDDGSTDQSLKLCHKLQKTDHRICVYYSAMYLGENENKNYELETTRNCGLERARGDWVMFLDSDDTYVTNAVENMVSFAQSHDADIVFSPYNEIVNCDTSISQADIEEGIYSQEEFSSQCLKEIPVKLLNCIGNKIYKRDLIEEYKIRFDNYYHYNEDAAFMLQALMIAKRIGYTKVPFYNYYIRETGSIQSSYRENMFEFLMRTCNLYKIFFERNSTFEFVENEYFSLIANIAFGSLYNEVDNSKYKKFKDVFSSIKKCEHYEGMQKRINSFSFGQRMMIECMKMNIPILLYAMIKLNKRIATLTK